MTAIGIKTVSASPDAVQTIKSEANSNVVNSEDTRGGTHASGGGNAFLLMPMTLFFILLTFAVLRSPSLVSSNGIGSAIIVATPLVLATYALMAVVIAGRGTVDLSIGPLIGFINVTLIQLHGAEIIQNPITVFGYAILAGAAYQFIFALIVIYVRVQPIIVSLSGYLALSGINLVILPRPGGVAPEWMSEWGLGTTIFSPVLLILALASLAWILFAQSAFFTHLRLMGSDERAAYTSGVPISVVRIGAHLISGAFAGLAAITFTALISSGDPSQGTTYTLIAVTALVLGGASLAGGRGGVFGSFLGAINLYLITYGLATFNFGAVQSFVTNLAYGFILVASLLLTLAIPVIQRYFKNFSALLYFVSVGTVVLGVILHSTFDYKGFSERAGAPPTAEVLTNTEATPQQRQPLAKINPSDLYVGALEIAEDDARTNALREQASPFIFGVIILVAIAVFARMAFSQAKNRDLAPAIIVIIAALVLFSGYLIKHGQFSPTEPPHFNSNSGGN